MNVHTVSFEEVTNLRELNSAFRRSLVRSGFEAFAGGAVRDGNKPASMFLQGWPRKWMAEYSANGYAADDPVLPQAIRSPEPFSAFDLELAPTDKATFVVAAARKFGWQSVIVVPMHGPASHRGLVSVASFSPKPTALHDRSLLAMCGVVYRRGLTLSRRDALAISPKEANALSLASSGLSDLEIADIMGISKNTAHRHVESAKEKLGAKSRAQAVSIAIAYGLI